MNGSTHALPQDHVNALWEKLIDATNKKNWDAAADIFSEVRSFSKEHNMRFMDLHLMYAHYLVNHAETGQALPHLDFLQSIYKQIGVTDESFLAVRGVPSFLDYVTVTKNCLENSPECKENIYLLENMVGCLDTEGETVLQEAIASMQSHS